MYSALKHQNVVGFYGITIPTVDSILMVTEFMARGCLRTVLDKKGSNLSWALRVKLARDAAAGMEYLHRRKGASLASVVIVHQHHHAHGSTHGPIALVDSLTM